MENTTSFDALKGGWQLFRSSWKPMVAYALLVWVATLCVLSPLVSWAINRLVAQSGELVVGNNEILNWLLSPKGILTFVLWGALTLLGLLLQVTGLIRIAFEGKQIDNWTVRQALHWLQTDLYPLFRFCLSAFLLFVLILLPLVVCLVAIYFILLGAHDINYYLSVKPTEWKWALIFCVLFFLLWGSAVCILSLRWI
jgi:glycerophosphoryl diester phosphodiesterase